MSEHDDVAEVTRLERRLLEPSLRADREQLVGLLHPDFVEHGQSGRVWCREDVASVVAQQPEVTGSAADFSGVRLADDVVLLTYRIDGPRASLRCSVWVREPGSGWRMRFHQGTPTG